MSSTTAAERPGFFTVAIFLHVLEGFLCLLASVLGLVGLAIGFVAVAINVDGEEAFWSIFGIALGAAAMGLIFFLGLLTLLISYKAWGMRRFWIWALIVFSLISIAFEPWGLILAGLTVIGGVQALEKTTD